MQAMPYANSISFTQSLDEYFKDMETTMFKALSKITTVFYSTLLTYELQIVKQLFCSMNLVDSWVTLKLIYF